MVREPVEQCRGHLRIAEDGRPFAEGEVGGDDDRSAFVEAADEMEQQLAASTRERKIAEFVKDQQVEPREMLGEFAGPALKGFQFEQVDQIGGVVEPDPGTAADAVAGDGDAEVGLSRSRAADQHDIALAGEEGAGGKVADQPFVDRCAGKLEAVEFACERQLGGGHLVLDGAGMLISTES